MSVLSELKPQKGAVKTARRIGRGDGSGWGGTAAKGHKGQKARSGGGVKPGFEGGQTPLYRRLPKFGFKNVNFKKRYTLLTLDQLNKLGGDITPESLAEKGLLKEKLVKVLGNGKIEKPVQVKVHKVTKSAKAAIEAAGGNVEVLS